MSYVIQNFNSTKYLRNLNNKIILYFFLKNIIFLIYFFDKSFNYMIKLNPFILIFNLDKKFFFQKIFFLKKYKKLSNFYLSLKRLILKKLNNFNKKNNIFTINSFKKYLLFNFYWCLSFYSTINFKKYKILTSLFIFQFFLNFFYLDFNFQLFFYKHIFFSNFSNMFILYYLNSYLYKLYSE